MSTDNDDDTTPIPYGMLFDDGRKDPRAREWENERMRLVEEVAQLKAQLAAALAEKATAILERAQLVLEVNRLRKRK